MKQITSLALIMFLAIGSAFAKNKSTHTTVKGENVSVTYGQPTKKTGNVIPAFGTAWHTGVDEATLVTLPKGCMFAGRQVNPGTYSLITVPYKGEWIIYLVNDKSSGAIDLDKVKTNNMVYSNAVIKRSDKTAEVFTINADAEGLEISWDNNLLKIPVQPW